jgi:hypothetical protein
LRINHLIPTLNSQIQPSAENTPTVAQNRAGRNAPFLPSGLRNALAKFGCIRCLNLRNHRDGPLSLASAEIFANRMKHAGYRNPIQRKRHDSSRKLSAATSSCYARVAGTERLHRMLSENQHTNASNQVLTKDKRCAAGGPCRQIERLGQPLEDGSAWAYPRSSSPGSWTNPTVR